MVRLSLVFIFCGLFALQAISQNYAQPDYSTLFENIPQVINVRANDNYDPAQYYTCQVTNQQGDTLYKPQHGTIVVLNNYSIMYIPDSNFVGADSFVYGIAVFNKVEVVLDTARVYVNVLNADSSVCQAGFTFHVNPSNYQVSFNGFNTMESPSNTVQSYSWSFGDSTTSNIASPIHYFSSNSSVVCLTIQTSNGCTSTFCDTVVIVENSCQANFNFAETVYNNGFYFNDLSTGNSISNWSWSFGNNTYSTEQNPSIVYTNTGVYQVCLTITAGGNCQSTYCSNVYASSEIIDTSQCHPYFTFETDSICNTCIAFTNATIEDSYAWSWQFGDGTTSNEENPMHAFSAPGNYLVCLKVYTTNGCIKNICQIVTISENPECNVSISLIESPQANTFAFTGLGNLNIISWRWNLGDGAQSLQREVTHTYADSGSYQVCLEIQTSAGCVSEQCIEVVAVGQAQLSCHADFSVQVGLELNSFEFHDLSVDDVEQWQWNFGDGTISTEANPVHTYPDSGHYQVCLTIYTSDTCSDTECHEVFAPYNIDTIIAFGSNVYAGSALLPEGMAILYDVENNYRAVASTPVINGLWFFIAPPGQYMVYIIPYFNLNVNYFPTYFPTYYGNEIHWQNSSVIDLSNTTSIGDIHLKSYGEMIYGSGAATGTISALSGESYEDQIYGVRWFSSETESIRPNSGKALHIPVLLMNSTNTTVKFYLTSENGDFSFNGLPFGDYSIYPEKAGFTTYPAYFSLQSQQPVASHVEMSINHSHITSVESNDLTDIFSKNIFPNPAENKLYIELKTSKPKDIKIEATSMLGNTIYQQKVKIETGSNVIEIPVSTWSKGLYTLTLIDSEGNSYSKLIVH